MIVLLLIVLSACSFEAFRENVILPNLDYEEGEAKIENYLSETYVKDFTIIETKRACNGLGTDCASEIESFVYANDTPDLVFSVEYDPEKHTFFDNYHSCYWKAQIAEEMDGLLQKSFGEEVKVNTFLLLNGDLLAADSFPNYKHVLGDEIKNMELDVSTLYWEENDERWIKEARNLIKFKESLLAIGLEEQDMQYIELKMKVKNSATDETTVLYRIDLSNVLDEESVKNYIQEYDYY